MDVIAYTKYLRISPRKVRIIASGIKKMSLEQVLAKMPFLLKAGAKPILKTVQSALANAEKNYSLKSENLIIKNIIVEESNRLKRMDRSHGSRFSRGIKQKRGCHIKVILTSK
ncbi:50S ribosomal protein L22 [Candidatus Gottesmanbacteria bacterium]|nr:50S ribosomal protein L22 [Candidatus Gottesmanbacteria bacterium]